MSGVPGGGSIRENSEARVKMGVWLGERATIRFVPALRAATRDCGGDVRSKSYRTSGGKTK